MELFNFISRIRRVQVLFDSIMQHSDQDQSVGLFICFQYDFKTLSTIRFNEGFKTFQVIDICA